MSNLRVWQELALMRLEAGAADYPAKGSFHNEALLQAVVALIGEVAA